MAGAIGPSGSGAAPQAAPQSASGPSPDGKQDPRQVRTFDEVLTTISTQMAQDALNEMDQAIQDTDEDSQ